MSDDDFATPQPVTRLAGKVVGGLYAKGTKSERQAVFIETASGRYLLRRKTGPVFDDSELVDYVGHRIECDGFIIGTTLLAETLRRID